MAKRQQRIPAGQLTPAISNDLINTWCTLVRNNNSAIFVKVIASTDATLTVVTQLGKTISVARDSVREIIVDSHA